MLSCPTSIGRYQNCSTEVYVVQHSYESFKQCMHIRLGEEKKQIMKNCNGTYGTESLVSDIAGDIQHTWGKNKHCLYTCKNGMT